MLSQKSVSRYSSSLDLFLSGKLLPGTPVFPEGFFGAPRQLAGNFGFDGQAQFNHAAYLRKTMPRLLSYCDVWGRSNDAKKRSSAPLPAREPIRRPPDRPTINSADLNLPGVIPSPMGSENSRCTGLSQSWNTHPITLRFPMSGTKSESGRLAIRRSLSPGLPSSLRFPRLCARQL